MSLAWFLAQLPPQVAIPVTFGVESALRLFFAAPVTQASPPPYWTGSIFSLPIPIIPSLLVAQPAILRSHTTERAVVLDPPSDASFTDYFIGISLTILIGVATDIVFCKLIEVCLCSRFSEDLSLISSLGTPRLRPRGLHSRTDRSRRHARRRRRRIHRRDLRAQAFSFR